VSQLLRVCSTPGCPELTREGRCDTHETEARQASDAQRPSSAERGYGARWRRVRARFLAAHPTCVLCGRRSEVPDHWPRTRAKLVAAGVADPDAPAYLRALCTRCHNSETASRPRSDRGATTREGEPQYPRAPKTAGDSRKTSVRVGDRQRPDVRVGSPGLR
jgi:5-methylcytosine-specific restriction protein A